MNIIGISTHRNLLREIAHRRANNTPPPPPSPYLQPPPSDGRTRKHRATPFQFPARSRSDDISFRGLVDMRLQGKMQGIIECIKQLNAYTIHTYYIFKLGVQRSVGLLRRKLLGDRTICFGTTRSSCIRSSVVMLRVSLMSPLMQLNVGSFGARFGLLRWSMPMTPAGWERSGRICKVSRE